MTSLRPSSRNELDAFDKIDHQDHASKFLTQLGIKGHLDFYDDPDNTYLSIENNEGELTGYILLVLEPDRQSLECRRIAIDKNKRGIGQAAMKEMENFGRSEFGVQRIWLDVFEDNNVGRHIYEKLGFKQFKSEPRDERNLLFYEKFI